MTDVKALLGELRASDPKFDEAQAVVDLVRSSGDMLERMRERKNWSQAELAERLGITAGRLSQLESGTLRNAPSLKIMARIAHACGETVKLGFSGAKAAIVQPAAAANFAVTDIMQELIALRGEVQELRATIRKPQPDALAILIATLKARETALARTEEKIAALTERNGHLEADVQISRANIEKRVVDLNSALQRERMERAVVEGALEAARKDNSRLQSEVAALRFGVSTDDEAEGLAEAVERQSSRVKA